jgi:predicted transcriptional regulator
VVKQAVEHLIDYEQWFAREVKAGLRDVERDRLIEHDAVVKKLERRREASPDARRRS